MKKQSVSILLILTIGFAAFTFGYHLGANSQSTPVTVSVPSSMTTVPPETIVSETETTPPEPTVSFPIDINLAGADEFMALPGIGEVLAKRIIAYRESVGGFSRVEDMLNVEGIGKKRFEAIYDLISIGG